LRTKIFINLFSVTNTLYPWQQLTSFLIITHLLVCYITSKDVAGCDSVEYIYSRVSVSPLAACYQSYL